MKLNLTDLSTKDLRKAAFAVGFGWYFGKAVGKLADRALYDVIMASFKTAARSGNEYAQEVCNKANVKYDKTEQKVEEKPETTVMGFHL